MSEFTTHASQPERRPPEFPGVDIQFAPKLDLPMAPTRRDVFTGVKKGPLTPDEVANIMQHRAPWEKPLEPSIDNSQADSVPDNVIPIDRKRRHRVLDFEGFTPSDAPLFTAEKIDPLRPTSAQIDAVLESGTDDEPISFLHASTGEEMGIADVKARQAAASEGITHESDAIHPEQEAAAELMKSKVAETAKAVDRAILNRDVRFGMESIGADGSVVESGALDDNHGVRVAYDSQGTITEVDVVAHDSGEMHEVSILTEPFSVLIDNEPATEAELPVAEAVLEHTVEQIDTQPAERESSTDEAHSEAADEQRADADTEDAEEKDEPTNEVSDSASLESVEKRMAENAQNFTEVYLRNPVTRNYVNDLGIDIDDIARRFELGEVSVTPETIKYMRQLHRNLNPNSPVWDTKPGTKSDLGKAADDARRHIAEILKRL